MHELFDKNQHGSLVKKELKSFRWEDLQKQMGRKLTNGNLEVMGKEVIREGINNSET